MANIFLNGFKAKTGGGKSILNNYLSLLMKNGSRHRFYVLTPDKNEYEKYRCDMIEIIDIVAMYKHNIFSPYVNRSLLPRMFEKLRIDLLFNMGDIVIPSDVPQIYLFDWPYAIYPQSVVWKRMDLASYFTRRIKLHFFKKYKHYARLVIAQTPTAKKRLENLYGLSNVDIVPNAVSLENMDGGEFKDYGLPGNKIKLLYLTYYYPHKNLEIFLPLARKIKRDALPYCLVITLASVQHVQAARILEMLKKEHLEDVVVNVGPVKMSNVPSLYKQCDGLLMPTLLESFSGTYVEAMYHRKTILTSRLDFAEDVCGTSAFYFDPLDEVSILKEMLVAFGNDELRRQKIEEGRAKLAQLPSWAQAFDKYQTLIEKTLSAAS